jgi:hypothetical protein
MVLKVSHCVTRVYLMGLLGFFSLHETGSFQHSFLHCYPVRTSLPNFPIFFSNQLLTCLLPSLMNFRPQLDVTAKLKKSVGDLQSGMSFHYSVFWLCSCQLIKHNNVTNMTTLSLSGNIGTSQTWQTNMMFNLLDSNSVCGSEFVWSIFGTSIVMASSSPLAHGERMTFRNTKDPPASRGPTFSCLLMSEEWEDSMFGRRVPHGRTFWNIRQLWNTMRRKTKLLESMRFTLVTLFKISHLISWSS